MARYTVDAVIADIDAHYKKMAEITSEDITGENPGSMPGSENDQPAPADAKKPDPEVVDDQVGGAANYDGKGMEAGSDNPKLEPQLLEANEPVLTPEKKPLDSTDVDAKTASDLGNDLVSMVLNHQKKPEVKKAEEKKPEVKKAEDCKDKDGADVPPENKPAPAPAPEKKPLDSDNAGAKEAEVDEIELSRDGLAKIAAVLMTREDGRQFIGKVLAEIGGEKFAEESINALGVKSAEAMAQAEFEKGAQDAAALLDGAEEAQGAADAEAALGDAAEAQGAADAEAALAGEGGGDELDEFSDEEIAEALQEMIESGELPPEAIEELMGGEDDGSVSEDDLANELVEMVQSGEITPEQAGEIVEALETEADPGATDELAADVSEQVPEVAPDAGAAPESAAPEAAAADPTAAEQMVAEAEAKAAAVKKAAARDLAHRLLAASKAIKEAKTKKAAPEKK